MGGRARRLGKELSLYRGLRPEALALLLYLADRVHALSGEPTPLTVTNTVRDDTYQHLLGATNPEASQNYSLHTTGYTFDILRRYGSRTQAAVFQYELERLQARGLIAWLREPKAIHITVSPEAKTLVHATLEPRPDDPQLTARASARGTPNPNSTSGHSNTRFCLGRTARRRGESLSSRSARVGGRHRRDDLFHDRPNSFSSMTRSSSALLS
jgi:hypothetical protein